MSLYTPPACYIHVAQKWVKSVAQEAINVDIYLHGLYVELCSVPPLDLTPLNLPDELMDPIQLPVQVKPR